MRLSIATASVALVLVVLALRGAFGDFPAEWEWVAVVLAALAVVMAFPPLFQMALGRPRLAVEIETDAQGEKRNLIVFLKNRPVTNRLIKKLGVKRETIQSLSAHVQVVEAGSGTILSPIRHARIFANSEDLDAPRERISLPPTYGVAAVFFVARWDGTSHRAVLAPDRLRSEEALPGGYFEARIIVTVDGEPLGFAGRFLVGQSADDLRWSPKSLKRVTLSPANSAD
ncbi:MAG: hypothetical protein V3S94_04195 [Gammaproteobacteria bacterium]